LGAQAASLQRPAACRANLLLRETTIDTTPLFRGSMFAASCRERQAGSLRSPI
jgi:hypothetical protein